MHVRLDCEISRRNALLHTLRDVDAVLRASVAIKLRMRFTNFSRSNAE
jgi:hypothetical protein